MNRFGPLGNRPYSTFAVALGVGEDAREPLYPSPTNNIYLSIMYYSLTKRAMSVGKAQGQVRYIANLVCQKQRISFEELCRQMSDGSTVSEADVAAVFYKLRSVLGKLCSLGYIVDAGPLGSFRPSLRVRAAESEEAFAPSMHIARAQIRFTPRAEFRELRSVEYHRVAPQLKKESSSPESSAPSGSSSAGDSSSSDNGSSGGSSGGSSSDF